MKWSHDHLIFIIGNSYTWKDGTISPCHLRWVQPAIIEGMRGRQCQLIMHTYTHIWPECRRYGYFHCMAYWTRLQRKLGYKVLYIVWDSGKICCILSKICLKYVIYRVQNLGIICFIQSIIWVKISYLAKYLVWIIIYSLQFRYCYTLNAVLCVQEFPL